jgi:hypothetical protein
MASRSQTGGGFVRAFVIGEVLENPRFNGFVFAFLDHRNSDPPKRQLAPSDGRH